MPSSRADPVNCRSILADRKVVPDDQIGIFCEILQFRREYGEHYDTEEGRAIYYNRLRTLLPKLKFPLSSNHGLASKLILPKQSEYTHLCDVHEGLNADFVHQWFKFLALEVGARLEILRTSNRDYIGSYAWDNVVKQLTRIHKMWERRGRINEAFGDFTDTGLDGVRDLISVERQVDGCEACILARIGSHEPTLFALRAAVKSRISLESSARHPRRLRLLRLIETWIQIWQARLDYRSDRQGARSQEMRDNTHLANNLYCKRKRLEVFLHENKYTREHGIKQDIDTDKEEEDTKDVFYQAEHDIIDTYSALRATQRQSLLLRSQVSLIQKHESATMLADGNPYKCGLNPAYDESRYSVDTISNNQRVVHRGSALAALHGVLGRRKQTDSAQTCWGDIFVSGLGQGSPCTTPRSRLAGNPEMHSNCSVSSGRGSARVSGRGAIPDTNAGTQASGTRASSDSHGPRVPTSQDMFDYRTYDANTAPETGSIVSSLSGTDLDHHGGGSPVSAMNDHTDYVYQQVRPWKSQRDSVWTDASVRLSVDAKLSRPFEQPVRNVGALSPTSAWAKYSTQI